MTHRPADFPARVRRLIAERAGYRCSKPDCRRQTLGPGTGPDDVACIGAACHIYAAAPGGPRGTGDLTLEQIQSAANGIWLCADHARLVDTGQGQGYPPPLLRGWRQLHEAYLVHEMRGLVPPSRLITEVNVREGPEGLISRTVNLSPLNIITGPSNVGKSALLNLLARAGRGGLHSARPWHGDLVADIHWFDPQPHVLEFRDRGGDVEVLHDHKRAPSSAASYHTVTLCDPKRLVKGLDQWAGLIGLDRQEFISLLRDVPQCVHGEISQVDIVDGKPVVRIHSQPNPIHLDGAAIGWAGIVLFEVAIALAQAHSLKGPTLLLIDDFGDSLHPAAVCKLLATLTSASQGFQTIVVTHHVLPPELVRDWSITAIGAHGYDTLFGESSGFD